VFPDPERAGGVEEPDTVEEGADTAGGGLCFVGSVGEEVGCEGLETEGLVRACVGDSWDSYSAMLDS